MRKKFCLILTVIIFSFCLTVSATNLRGRIVRYDPNTGTFFPLVNVRVDIWIFNGSQWVDWAWSITGGDGMYYFQNFAPGAMFRIQVFGNFYPEQSWYIQNVPLQDIPQIST